MSTTAPNALDVRPLPADRKVQAVRAVFEGLDVGDSFVLVDDRDPGTMRGRIEEERPGEAQWRYLKDGPSVWWVRVRRQSGAS
jgi:uncharacterized protein (DUF2249 family)